MSSWRINVETWRFLIIWAIAHALAAHGQFAARKLADLNPGAAGSYPSNSIVFGNSLLFVAHTPSTGTELWRYSSGQVALAADINDTSAEIGGELVGNSSKPDWLTVFDGAVYFSAWEPRHGGELWRYDGVTAARVTDIAVDANDNIKPNPNNSWPNELKVFGQALYFSANNSTTRTNYELWRHDGAAARLVADLHPDLGTNHGSYPSNLAEFSSALLFSADDGSHGFELWKHAGPGTSMAGDLNPGGGASSSFPKFFTPAAGLLFFQASNQQSGFELWAWNGTTATNIDLNPGAASSFAEEFAEFKGRLFFSANAGAHGFELWKHDGVSASLAADLNPAGDSFPRSLTAFGDILVFAANDGVHGWELWKFDGNATSLVRDLNPQGDSFPEFMIVHRGKLFFSAFTPETGYELWVFDGQQISLAADINEGPGSSYPRHFASFNDELFMAAAADGNTDWEPWALAPTGGANPPRIVAIERQGPEWLLSIETAPGTQVTLQGTTDLQSWTDLKAITVLDGAAVLSDSTLASHKFYRLAIKP